MPLLRLSVNGVVPRMCRHSRQVRSWLLAKRDFGSSYKNTEIKVMQTESVTFPIFFTEAFNVSE